MKKLLYIFIPIIIIGLIFAFYIFAKYYNSVETGLEEIYSYRNTKLENSLSELLSEILKFLGSDYEIVTNSAISCDIKLDSLFNTDDYEKLKNIIGPQLSHYTATPHTMKLSLYDVRNFKTNEIKKYFIAFYDDKELGIVVVGQKILENEQEISEIKNQITKRN